MKCDEEVRSSRMDTNNQYCVVNVEDFSAWKSFVTYQIKNSRRKAVVRRSEFCGENGYIEVKEMHSGI